MVSNCSDVFSVIICYAIPGFDGDFKGEQWVWVVWKTHISSKLLFVLPSQGVDTMYRIIEEDSSYMHFLQLSYILFFLVSCLSC